MASVDRMSAGLVLVLCPISSCISYTVRLAVIQLGSGLATDARLLEEGGRSVPK